MGINTLEICRESAAAYLHFLTSYKKGRDLNPVSDRSQDGSLFSLTVAKPLLSTDVSELFLELDGQTYVKGEFSIVAYDQDNLHIFVQPASDALCAK